MSRTYKAIGINLKSMPLGEADRLLTILTREHGLVKAIAISARKHNSKMSGRSGLFVVNDLLIAKGKSLDKITQAETVISYSGLGKDLKRLTASQYLAELCLYQALSDQPQDELFCILNEQLQRLERSPTSLILLTLISGIYQLLTVAGVAPEVHRCCVTQQPLVPNEPVGFSIPAGGTVTLESLEQLQQPNSPHVRITKPVQSSFRRNAQLHSLIGSKELIILQAIAQTGPLQTDADSSQSDNFAQVATSMTACISVERILRQYAQYHFDRSIRSATLMDACFSSSPLPQLSQS
ncbi:DNA repair protein RecO [Phormidium sp. CLA17]|uniref:DNA repair protein RecO n=1 Tax=Leptolyngbya sp. Cla-17 TaxID=2803751 RepID=UPI001491278F|nr:DNA repair protein RecO [Leptolyngbya sp. Cla-17]MBM0741281.1 DNA repair protein RecO [Leptolyngbya sp. Cla-17]